MGRVDEASETPAPVMLVVHDTRQGQTVHQGQVIGYVGTSGRSTGPHLHYEVLSQNRQVNPAGLKLPTGHKLAGAELASFQTARQAIDQAPINTPVVTAERETDR